MMTLYFAKKAVDVVAGEEIKKVWAIARDKAVANVQAIWKKAGELAGPKTEALTTSTVLALIQSGGGMDSPDLQDMFAHLLATELGGGEHHPAFTKVLGEMSPGEAKFLRAVATGGVVALARQGKLLLPPEQTPFSSENDADHFERLDALGLAYAPDPTLMGIRFSAAHRAREMGFEIDQRRPIQLTAFGRRFASVVGLPPREDSSPSG